ncbi:MAG: VWA domain-containing protein [Anaerolineae bacterium]|nr:VWA domain-containing protein [Anaerolineae bacterium]
MLRLRALRSHEQLPARAEEQAYYVLLEVALRQDLPYERMPLNLCLVLDRSTSMSGPRLQAVREGVQRIIDYISSDDVLSIVVFNDRAEVLLASQRNIDRARVRAMVSAIQPAGGTELLQGLGAGIRELMRGKTERSLNHLILLTDGHTYGDEQGCLEMAKWAGQNRISMSLMGLGEDWNESLLDQMAALSGGRSLYIDSPRKVAEAFEQIAHLLSGAASHQTQLHVALGPSVTLHEIFQLTPEIQRVTIVTTERGYAAELGLLGRDAGRELLMEFRVRDLKPGVQMIASVDLELIAPSGVESHQWNHEEITLHVEGFSPDDPNAPRISSSKIPVAIPNALTRVVLFKMHERAIADLEAGRIDAATQRLETMASRLAAMGETELARIAMLEAGQLARTGTLSPEGRKKIHYGTRALSSTSQGRKHG